MKKKKIVFAIIAILTITLVVFKYCQNQKKYEEYANEKLNQNFYKVCDYIINSNAVLKHAIENEYIFETDLEYLSNAFYAYLQSLHEIDNISKRFYEFTFFSVSIGNNFNREYSIFYYRINDLFENRDFDINSTKKYQLTQGDLDVFRQSYEYTSKVSGSIKDHIEYYNMFDIVVIEEEKLGRTQLMKEYKEEFLTPWADNKSGGGATVSIDENGTVTETPIEVPKYDYPKQPFMRIKDDEWMNVYKEMYSFNCL